MFYCESCRVVNEWPAGFGKSFGRCEVCGEHRGCHDVPSSRLPRTCRFHHFHGNGKKENMEPCSGGNSPDQREGGFSVFIDDMDVFWFKDSASALSCAEEALGGCAMEVTIKKSSSEKQGNI